MSNLMTGSSGYATGSIDTTTTLVNGTSPRNAEHINGPAAAIVQIETVLGSGTSLKGTTTDLVTRLAVALASDGRFKLTNGPAYVVDRGFTAVSSTEIQIMNHTPVGVINAFSGSIAPANWVLCDGSAISRATFAKLFAVTGTTYGVGDGSTTFNVPDLRGRVGIMVDGAANRITSASTNGANADTLGGVGGAETHTLSTSELAAHTHTIPGTSNAIAGTAATFMNASTATNNNVTSASTGGGNAHSNTQPWIALNYIIFAGV